MRGSVVRGGSDVASPRSVICVFLSVRLVDFRVACEKMKKTQDVDCALSGRLLC